MNIVLIGVRIPHSLESWADVHGSDRSRHVTRDSAEVLELLGLDAEVWESTREDSVPAVENSWMRPSVSEISRISAFGRRVLLQSDSRVLRFRRCQFND